MCLFRPCRGRRQEVASEGAKGQVIHIRLVGTRVHLCAPNTAALVPTLSRDQKLQRFITQRGFLFACGHLNSSN
jgi:hypothetical protein